MSAIEIDTNPNKNIWPEIPLIYEGTGSLEFLDPSISITGKATVQFDGLGEGFACIKCNGINFINHVDSDLIQLLKNDSLSVQEYFKVKPLIDQISNNVIKKFEVKLSNGIFSLTDNNHRYERRNNLITLRFLNSKFISEILSEKTQIKYMLLPITNFIFSEFNSSDFDFREHPLRTGYGDKLICFYIEDNPCFIEPLDNYDNLQKELLDGNCNRETTAVMVCDLGSTKMSILDIEHILDLLSISTGIEIGAPWIEYRDVQGKLIERVHVQLNQWSKFSKGHRVFDDWTPNGIKDIISGYWSSTYRKNPDLTAIIRNIVKSGFHDLTTEDRLSHLFRALDCLCQAHELGSVDLRDNLSDDQAKFVTEAYKLFKEKIGSISKDTNNKFKDAIKAGRLDDGTRLKEQYNILQGIADSISQNPPYIDNRYGRKVIQLLNYFRIIDVPIINNFYKDNPRPDKKKNFIGVLSYYRGVTMHKGYFDFHGDIYLQNDIRRVGNHLHDILLRITLKMLCYEGIYKSPISHTPVTIDWVNPTCIFSWSEVQGMDEKRLRNFIIRSIIKSKKRNSAIIDKLAKGKSLSLELNVKANEAILKIDNVSIFKLTTECEEDKLNIYLPIYAKDLGYINL